MTTLWMQTALKLIERGYSVIPIIPGEKRPGEWRNGQWVGMNNWQRYCDRAPTKFELDMWAKWPEASICVALGRASNLTAIDFDYGSDEVRAALESIVPVSPVRKTGAKGYTAFLRGFALVPRKYTVDSVSVIEVLGHGRQTVLPPSMHPEGMAYRWLTPETLESLTVDELPELPRDLHERIASTLEPFQMGMPDRLMQIPASHGGGPFSSDDSPWRELNNTALENLDSWVLNLLPDSKRGAGGGYRAIAHWRGDTAHNVGIHPNGIVDFPGDRKMTPIDLVMTVSGADLGTAATWLKTSLGIEPPPEYVLELEQAPTPTEPYMNGHKVEVIPAVIPAPKPPVEATSGQPNALHMLVDYINSTAHSPQPILAMGAALCALGTLAGRKYKSPTDLRTNLYAVGIADSGAGKDHARKVIDKLFIQYLNCGHFIGGDRIASGAGLLQAIHRQPSILFKIDEFGSVLGATSRRGAPNHLAEIPLYLTSLFTTSAGIFQGAEFANAKERPRLEIHQPCASVYGTTTPGQFWRGLENSHSVDGVLTRFLIFETEESYPDERPWIDREPSEQLVNLLQRIAHRDVGGELGGSIAPGNLVVATYTPEASEMLDELQRAILKWQRGSTSENAKAFMARKRELTIKVAMINAIGRDPENPIIDKDDVNFALFIVERSINRMLDGLDRFVADNASEDFNKKVIEIIRRAGGTVDKTELYRKTLFLGRERQNVMDSLIEGKFIFAKIATTSGRSKTYYTLAQ